jgi:hypothetical protein
MASLRSLSETIRDDAIDRAAGECHLRTHSRAAIASRLQCRLNIFNCTLFYVLITFETVVSLHNSRFGSFLFE